MALGVLELLEHLVHALRRQPVQVGVADVPGQHLDRPRTSSRRRRTSPSRRICTSLISPSRPRMVSDHGRVPKRAVQPALHAGGDRATAAWRPPGSALRRCMRAAASSPSTLRTTSPIATPALRADSASTAWSPPAAPSIMRVRMGGDADAEELGRARGCRWRRHGSREREPPSRRSPARTPCASDACSSFGSDSFRTWSQSSPIRSR